MNKNSSIGTGSFFSAEALRGNAFIFLEALYHMTAVGIAGFVADIGQIEVGIESRLLHLI